MRAASAAAVSIMLLVFLAWRINGMEKEIHDLTLRDELTGLQLLDHHAERLDVLDGEETDPKFVEDVEIGI